MSFTLKQEVAFTEQSVTPYPFISRPKQIVYYTNSDAVRKTYRCPKHDDIRSMSVYLGPDSI